MVSSLVAPSLATMFGSLERGGGTVLQLCSLYINQISNKQISKFVAQSTSIISCNIIDHLLILVMHDNDVEVSHKVEGQSIVYFPTYGMRH